MSVKNDITYMEYDTNHIYPINDLLKKHPSICFPAEEDLPMNAPDIEKSANKLPSSMKLLLRGSVP